MLIARKVRVGGGRSSGRASCGQHVVATQAAIMSAAAATEVKCNNQQVSGHSSARLKFI